MTYWHCINKTGKSLYLTYFYRFSICPFLHPLESPAGFPPPELPPKNTGPNYRLSVLIKSQKTKFLRADFPRELCPRKPRPPSGGPAEFFRGARHAEDPQRASSERPRETATAGRTRARQHASSSRPGTGSSAARKPAGAHRSYHLLETISIGRALIAGLRLIQEGAGDDIGECLPKKWASLPNGPQ